MLPAFPRPSDAVLPDALSSAPSQVLACTLRRDGSHHFPADWLLTQLMLGSVYHKHSPLCGHPSMGRQLEGDRWVQCGDPSAIALDRRQERRRWDRQRQLGPQTSLQEQTLAQRQQHAIDHQERALHQPPRTARAQRRRAAPVPVDWQSHLDPTPVRDFFTSLFWEYDDDEAEDGAGPRTGKLEVDDDGDGPRSCGVTEALPIFDLTTSLDAATCHGTAAAAAAAALDTYHELLAALTPLRTAMLRLLFPRPLGNPVPPTLIDRRQNLSSFVAATSHWMLHRLGDPSAEAVARFGDGQLDLYELDASSTNPAPSCETRQAVLDGLERAHRLWLTALPKLRAVAPALMTSCISPPRSYDWFPSECTDASTGTDASEEEIPSPWEPGARAATAFGTSAPPATGEGLTTDSGGSLVGMLRGGTAVNAMGTPESETAAATGRYDGGTSSL